MSDPTTSWDSQHPAAAEQSLRAATDGADPHEQVALTTELAHTLTLQGEYDEAHRVLDDLSPTSDEVAVRIVLERGRLLLAEGRADEARPQLEAAAQTAAAARLDDLYAEARSLLDPPT